MAILSQLWALTMEQQNASLVVVFAFEDGEEEFQASLQQDAFIVIRDPGLSASLSHYKDSTCTG